MSARDRAEDLLRLAGHLPVAKGTNPDGSARLFSPGVGVRAEHISDHGLARVAQWAPEVIADLLAELALHDDHARLISAADDRDAHWPTGTVIQEIHDCDQLCGDCFYPPLWEMAFQCGWSRVGKLYDPNDDRPAFPCRVLWVPADGAEEHQ